MDKYCTLMVEVHKLEETNNALATRLERITASQRANEANAHSSTAGSTRCRRSVRKSSSKHDEEKMPEDIENTVPLTPQRSPQGSLSGKRGRRDVGDKDSAQEALHNLTKKIKANAVATPKARSEKEDEFRPEGLPELVQRGFADIPLGEKSPFIMRRTTVKRCSPRLVARKTGPVSSPDGTSASADSSNRKRLSLSGEEKPARQSLSSPKSPEQKETQQADNCHVQ
ncbi:unnamed protein product [Pleuronectes platessa]|uniref:Kinetochore protein Cenp-F/LEK1 Rb protein-binding domain-containing protein n=1 Tax=Pleuronectes platessa TaxID=8262 RepID=A0A9N7ZD88_PLEPL|nr:unnamed protein product [Pleuronectes platessa]